MTENQILAYLATFGALLVAYLMNGIKTMFTTGNLLAFIVFTVVLLIAAILVGVICKRLTAGAAVMLPVALLVDRPWLAPLPSLGAWGAILALAIVCSAFAYILYFRILASAGATNLLLVTFLIPVSAILFGAAALLGMKADLGGLLLLLPLLVLIGTIVVSPSAPVAALAGGGAVLLGVLLLGLARRRRRGLPGPPAGTGTHVDV